VSDEDRLKIVEAIIRACMWGQGGIAGVILENLDKTAPDDLSWQALYRQNYKRVNREAVGVIVDEGVLRNYLGSGYWLVNFDEDGCSLFNPPPMNGLASYVSKELADKHRANFASASRFMAAPSDKTGEG
jgi:hypothetical protein